MSDTVIILQDECIIAATGKEGRVPKIGNVERIPLEGYGEMAELWKAALIRYMQLHKPSQVKLVLPASGSSARMSQIPYASGKQLAGLAQNVMAESSGESVSDYAVIQSDKKQGISLCCGSADTDTLLKMIGMCMEAGLPLREITVPMEGYLKILAQLKEYRKKTAIYLFFEENSVTSLLYREGIYLYSTRSRLFSERGTVDFGTEIVRNISGIMQFYATVKGTTPITDVYYAGCMDDDFEVSMDGIRNMNLQVHPLKVDIPTEVQNTEEAYLPCYGAFIEDKKKGINLYRAWQEQSAEKGVQRESLGRTILFPAWTFVICLAVFAGVTIANQALTMKIRNINDWMMDPSIQEQYQKANERKEVSSQLAEAIRQVKQTTKNLDTYPDLTTEMILMIEDVGGQDMEVKIQTMDMETGTLTFNAVSRKVIDIPVYVQKLEDTGLFYSVDYTGYSYNDSVYTLMLTCVLEEAQTGGSEQ